MSVLMQRLFAEIESASESIQTELLDYVLLVKAQRAEPSITQTPGVCGGEACLGQTRIAVWMLEAARRNGSSEPELLEDYPRLRLDDLRAAWTYVEAHADEIESAIGANLEA